MASVKIKKDRFEESSSQALGLLEWPLAMAVVKV
jgi:hypothetical protein